MLIQSATFIGSFVKEKECPKTGLPEFAFIGRSNVGKSSLINMLVNRKDLVKVSRAPGKTQTLNFFNINERLYFVDLPGYGYAKVSRSLRHQWTDMISQYLQQRRTLQCVFILADARLEPQQSDLDFVNQLGTWRIPFAIIFTKSDKVGKSQVSKHVSLFHAALKPVWSTLPVTFISSTVSKAGKDDILKFIAEAITPKKPKS
ncbi:MAG: YihA family ribosome biogenesis GTP-binding protein [Chitinophagaceae bacterium]|nr:YihA family ribosome biogenesis GTP-binding protein [Chitinophagaceae bacterium]